MGLFATRSRALERAREEIWRKIRYFWRKTQLVRIFGEKSGISEEKHGMDTCKRGGKNKLRAEQLCVWRPARWISPTGPADRSPASGSAGGLRRQ